MTLARTRDFQLWIALPPELELGATASTYQAPGDVRAACEKRGKPELLTVFLLFLVRTSQKTDERRAFRELGSTISHCR
jgi:hypothetical protein